MQKGQASRGAVQWKPGQDLTRCSNCVGSLADILRRMHHGLAICRVHLVQPLHTESTDDDEIGNDYARGDSIEYCPGRYQNNDDTVTSQSISI